MIKDFFESIKNFIFSRLFVSILLFAALGTVLVIRIFDLQIVKGEEYLENYQLKIVRDRTISSTRGNIYDRNGNLLAYDTLAYSVTMADVFDGNNVKMNDTILLLTQLIESNHDKVISDYSIYLDDNNEYKFNVEGTKLLRFLADVYGHTYVDDLTPEERNSTPDDVINFAMSKKKYFIGHYDEDKNFIPGDGYSKSDILKIITLRTAISANAYKKYINTPVATNVSDLTIAKVLENTNNLPGVGISQDTIRKYNDSVYFAPIIGYTGKISTEEYEEYSRENPDYALTDYVGKTGIEYSQELKLQGKKGSETIYVDNLGTVLETTDSKEPVAGNDIYLTIDKDLQMAIYNILEQKLAGILVAKIRDQKEYIAPENASSSDIYIPIDDVYFALFDNNVINTSRFSKDYASDTEKAVYDSFISFREGVFEELRDELIYNDTVYDSLSLEYKNYESFIVTMLSSENYGVLDKSKIDTESEMYKAWTTDENISLKTYLQYCISKNWIDTTVLETGDKYSSSDEIYVRLVDYIIDKLSTNNDFSKKIYKYMIASNTISGRQVCVILWDQDIINVEENKIVALKNGSISSFTFMIDCISALEITPAQLALQPCSASCVVTDVTNGDVLALVSYPGYDNNKLANSADSAYLAKLNNDKSKPLWNYATQYKCAPGSTFKMVSSVAGISENVITLDSEIQCTGQFDKLNGTIHNCWIYPGSHGNLTVSGGIANSCNCFFYEVGYRLAQDADGYNADVGVEKIAKYADMFGLSEKSGVEISEVEPEISDILPVPSAIGQGTHAYTTVGLSRYVSAVANSGTVYDLTLIDKVTDPYGNLITDNSATIRNRIELPSSVWNSIHSGMRQVVQNKNYFNIGVNVAGKTGTAQESKSKANHALFVGYAPYESPEISVATRIMNGYTSDYSAQITKDVIMYYYNLAEEDELITGTADQPLAVSGNGD